MSKHDKIAKLKEYIKNFVIKELEKDEELDEVSTTATAGIDGTGTGHYDTPHAFASGSAVGDKSPEVGGYKKVNEKVSAGEMFDDMMKTIKKSDEKKALKRLIDEFELGRVYYMFSTNRRGFFQAVLQTAALMKAKNLKEATKQEVNALKKFIKDFDKMQKQYWNISKIGDQELKDPKYNKHYETILAAQKSIVQLAREIQEKERVGEGLNEGRYHDWRNDESLTPKQKVGKSVREIRDALNELDKTVKMNLKLKTELNMNSQDYWKNTHKALTKISERLVKMANKIGNLK